MEMSTYNKNKHFNFYDFICNIRITMEKVNWKTTDADMIFYVRKLRLPPTDLSFFFFFLNLLAPWKVAVHFGSRGRAFQNWFLPTDTSSWQDLKKKK